MIRRFFSFFLILASLVLVGQGCFGGGGEDVAQPVTLRYWRVFDGEDDFARIIEAYEARNPQVRIDYRRLRFEDYEEELIRAFAEDRGPDIFTFHNTELAEYKSLLYPMPSQVTVTQQERKNNFTQATVTVPVTKSTLSMRALRDQFVDQVIDDVVSSGRSSSSEVVYGLPLALDTMVLYYNIDLLNAAGIPTPPRTWDDFQEQVQAVTQFDSEGAISRPGASIGTSANVERATDILTTIMRQVGVTIENSNDQLSFRNRVATDGTPYDAAIEALNFYTDFANPGRLSYTWNEEQPNSLEAFTSGKTAFFFGYAYHAPIIRTNAPRLRFDITNFPQPAGDNVAKAYSANYWVEGVAASSDHKNWAWDFLLFATSDSQAADYVERAQKPTAHKRLIQDQLSDDFLGIFAQQVLLARSWYEGEDVNAAETALRDLIDTFIRGTDEPGRAIQTVERRIQATQ